MTTPSNLRDVLARHEAACEVCNPRVTDGPGGSFARAVLRADCQVRPLLRAAALEQEAQDARLRRHREKNAIDEILSRIEFIDNRVNDSLIHEALDRIKAMLNGIVNNDWD